MLLLLIANNSANNNCLQPGQRLAWRWRNCFIKVEYIDQMLAVAHRWKDLEKVYICMYSFYQKSSFFLFPYWQWRCRMEETFLTNPHPLPLPQSPVEFLAWCWFMAGTSVLDWIGNISLLKRLNIERFLAAAVLCSLNFKRNTKRIFRFRLHCQSAYSNRFIGKAVIFD